MTDELHKLYRSLEEKVRQKTLRLQEANRMLKVLYNCSQALDAAQQVHLLQIIREALLNAIKHAQATTIVVSCHTQPDGGHCVDIRDDGRGIGSHEEPAGHYGLNIMHERAERLGGTLSIGSHPEGGTRVSVCFSAPATAHSSTNDINDKEE